MQIKAILRRFKGDKCPMMVVYAKGALKEEHVGKQYKELRLGRYSVVKQLEVVTLMPL